MEGYINPTTGRRRTCECGTCQRCKHRDYMRSWYHRKSTEERRALVLRRDPETVLRLDRERHERDRGKRLAAMQAYQSTRQGNAVHKRSMARYFTRYPDRYIAHNSVSNAIRDGRLTRGPCDVCGATVNVQGHHDDYSRPLEVRWLCRDHHRQLHAARQVA